ncbi:glutathione S-transferase family protein [Bosea sp. BIWAKO-01]|uniref:glutathione S-transferase family protein n=1 Tax=Bosea sp. BIWAKO-01 TaxID=506668 RepID=UPI00086CF4B9|nr:glutathione S-transferase family protein [Bosea sp. BIWAKO-01]GAU83422.1 glutathione S-transferase family protein [Bosea sp. BIWAKO-01]
MILYCAPASPFSRKVRMLTRHLGFEGIVDERFVDTATPDAAFLAANPLSKIPTLITLQGDALFDSAVIAAYLDAQSGHALSQRGDAYFVGQAYEALADGVMEAIVLIIYERRWRQEAKREPRWTAHQEAKITRGLARASQIVVRPGHRLQIGDFSLAAALGYLDLRFEGAWRATFPVLAGWLYDFAAQVPAFEATRHRDSPSVAR